PGCTDKVENGDETDVDCGGGTCPQCADGKMCIIGTDCTSGNCATKVCAPAATCNDMKKNGAQTDVDCGGGTCPPCAGGKLCMLPGRGAAGECSNGICTGLKLKLGFGAAMAYGGGSVLWSIDAGDLNGDGKLDLAVADISAASTLTLLGKGDGTFGA